MQQMGCNLGKMGHQCLKVGPVLFQFFILRKLLELPFVSPLQNVQYALHIQFLGIFFAFPLGDALTLGNIRSVRYATSSRLGPHAHTGTEGTEKDQTKERKGPSLFKRPSRKISASPPSTSPFHYNKRSC
jgi:hypothetical protein